MDRQPPHLADEGADTLPAAAAVCGCEPGPRGSSAGRTDRPVRATDVRDVAAWLGTADGAGIGDSDRIDLLRALEELKGATAAGQARVTVAFADSQQAAAPQGVDPAAVARSIASQVALARRESPHKGSRLLGLARALTSELPATMAALQRGATSEWRATLICRETAVLSTQDRLAVDAALGPDLPGLGDKAVQDGARRLAEGLDPAASVTRRRRAVRSRRVSCRPAPDGMAYLTVLGPVAEVVGAFASLQRHAKAVLSGTVAADADGVVETPDERGLGQVMADAALRWLSGRRVGQAQPVEVNLVMTDVSLFGTGTGPGTGPDEDPGPADHPTGPAHHGCSPERTTVQPQDTRPQHPEPAASTDDAAATATGTGTGEGTSAHTVSGTGTSVSTGTGTATGTATTAAAGGSGSGSGIRTEKVSRFDVDPTDGGGADTRSCRSCARPTRATAEGPAAAGSTDKNLSPAERAADHPTERGWSDGHAQRCSPDSSVPAPFEPTPQHDSPNQPTPHRSPNQPTPHRSPDEPARIPGHGSVPAAVARALVLGDSLDYLDGYGGDAERDSHGTGAGATTDGRSERGDPDDAPARVWLRRLFTAPNGRDLVAMDSTRRVFTGQLRRLLVLRDDVCRTPWCDAPIRDIDHAVPYADGGPTSAGNGNGRCRRCNLVKEFSGWTTRVASTGPASSTPTTGPCHPTGPPHTTDAPHTMETTTPTGHTYASVAPPILGTGWQNPATPWSDTVEEPQHRGDVTVPAGTIPGPATTARASAEAAPGSAETAPTPTGTAAGPDDFPLTA